MCVPLSRLPQIIVETKKDLIENKLTGEQRERMFFTEADSVLMIVTVLDMIDCEFNGGAVANL